MTVTEAARKIGISPSKLYQLCSARAISHYRVGGKIVFTENDIEKFMESCRVGVVQEQPVAPRVLPKLKHLRLA